MIKKDRFHIQKQLSVNYALFTDDHKLILISDELTFEFSMSVLKEIKINELNFIDWITSMLDNRLVSTPNNKQQCEEVSKYFQNEPLFVKETNKEYLYTTFMKIIEQYLDSDITLEGIKYKINL